MFIILRGLGREKGEAGKLQLDHNHRGHSNAISFSMQSHNPMAQTFALIRHLGNASIPFHFISSNPSHISIKWIHWDEESSWTRYYYQRELLHYCLLWLPVFLLHVVGNTVYKACYSHFEKNKQKEAVFESTNVSQKFKWDKMTPQWYVIGFLFIPKSNL